MTIDRLLVSQVARRFLAAVKECSGPGLNMAMFISYNPEDIIRQAEESTIRYQQGRLIRQNSYTCVSSPIQLRIAHAAASIHRP
jgi:hypothetical protein